MFQGKSIRLRLIEEGLVELCFDREGESINKLDQRTVAELGQATQIIGSTPSIRGVLVTSTKDAFIVGADITEFGEMFKMPLPELVASLDQSNTVATAFEDLPVPSVAAINGFALGGGLELALCATYRVMSAKAQIGLPEVSLGLFPGMGGTVRLPRISGPAEAVDWIAGGRPVDAKKAESAGVVDLVSPPEALRESALGLLRQAAVGEMDWRSRQARKRAPVATDDGQWQSVFETTKTKLAAGTATHQPAALMAVRLMERSVLLDREQALHAEAKAFAEVTKTQAASALVQTFLSDQVVRKNARKQATNGRALRQCGVLGAGIMGGGIAYTLALRGLSVRMKDIAPRQLERGMTEAAKLLSKQVKGGRKTQEQADKILGGITPQLDYNGFGDIDMVIEAVVEDIGVKRNVLAALENVVRQDTVIASNTSSLLIDDIARALGRPENFVGLHFFNPVPVMPLVEVIKGTKTSDAAVATAVSCGLSMGKIPVVVKDCPGFLVNRVLTPYIRGFLQLIADGADFIRVDRVMEAFGWPMGPAYLEDVLGMDTGSHVNDLISAGYGERMPPLEHDALRLMAGQGRYGQKNGIGFYRYELDPGGKPKRSEAADTHDLLAAVQPKGRRDFSDEEIVDRMMLPLVIEAAHALEEAVVETAAELDLALLLGIGFPAYLGGALKYADWLGLDEVVRRAGRYAALGPMYRPTSRMLEMAAEKTRYYP